MRPHRAQLKEIIVPHMSLQPRSREEGTGKWLGAPQEDLEPHRLVQDDFRAVPGPTCSFSPPAGAAGLELGMSSGPSRHTAEPQPPAEGQHG